MMPCFLLTLVNIYLTSQLFVFTKTDNKLIGKVLTVEIRKDFGFEWPLSERNMPNTASS